MVLSLFFGQAEVIGCDRISASVKRLDPEYSAGKGDLEGRTR